MAAEAPGRSGTGGTPDVVPASQLQLVNDQLRRSPFVVVAIDIFLAWLLLRAGVSPWVFAWVVFSGLLQIGRVIDVQRIVNRGGPPSAGDLNRIHLWFFVLGAVRAWPVVLAFGVDNSEVQFLVTLVTIGSAAGGLGTAAGLVKAYAAWVIPLGTVQVGAWLLHNDFEGRWIAGLMTLLLTLLVLNVRSYGHTLQQLGKEVERAETVSSADMGRKLAWRQGDLIYTGQPLKEVLADVSRYSDIKIELADPALENLPVGGAFRTDQIGAIFAALENNFGVHAQWIGPQHVRFTSSGDKPPAKD